MRSSPEWSASSSSGRWSGRPETRDRRPAFWASNARRWSRRSRGSAAYNPATDTLFMTVLTALKGRTTVSAALWAALKGRTTVIIVVLAIAVAVWQAEAQQPAQGSASAGVAIVQGHVIVALTDLLNHGAGTPVAIKTRTPLARRYSGPDAALLQLQADAIALGLEA